MEKRPSQILHFFVKLREKNIYIFYKQLLRTIFYMIFGFITDINTKDQVQTNITSIDTDANSKKIKSELLTCKTS